MPEEKPKIETPFDKYLECLKGCKGDCKCEDRCGDRWNDAIYKYLYRFDIPKIPKMPKINIGKN